MRLQDSSLVLIQDIVKIHTFCFPSARLTLCGEWGLSYLLKLFIESSFVDFEVLVDENDYLIGYTVCSDKSLKKIVMERSKTFYLFFMFILMSFMRNPKMILENILDKLFRPVLNSSMGSSRTIFLFSICSSKSGGGTFLMHNLISKYQEKYQLISLETDALENEKVIEFYEKHGFHKETIFTRWEGRKMLKMSRKLGS